MVGPSGEGGQAGWPWLLHWVAGCYNSCEMDPRIGTEFAGHRIEAVIGFGGASVVYLAEHLRLGRKVALKVLAPHLADDAAFRERFIRESRIAAALDHPNIVTVYDAGEIDGNLYISMRHVEGSDLGKLLASHGALEISRTVSILSQIADALDAAHAQGLVHRDVKPANMLIEAPGETTGVDRAYLSDFGISKRTTSREGLTRTGQFVGTVDYVAPEQITAGPVDERTDVYSLGCVLFECLTGHVPFPQETGVATIYSHLHDAPPRLEPFGDRSAGLAGIVQKALAKSRDRRFASCGEMLEAVRRQTVPTTTRTSVRTSVAEPGPAQRGGAHRTGSAAQSAGRRRRAAILSATAAALTVLVIVALTIVLPRTRSGQEGGRDPGPVVPDDAETTGPSGPTEPEPPLQLTWTPGYTLEKFFGGSGRQAILDATVTDDAFVFAVGHVTRDPFSALDDAAVWRSDDGRRWEAIGQASLSQEGDQRMNAVTVFEDVLVAAGQSGSDAAVWTSTDQGENWSMSEALELRGVGATRIRDLVSNGSELIAVGSTGAHVRRDAAVWTSSDALDWRRMDAAAFQAPGQQEMFAATAVGDRLFAVGSTNELGDIDAAVWLLESGIWTRLSTEPFAQTGHEVMLDVGGGGGLPLVAVGCEDPVERCDVGQSPGSDAAVWTSGDGSSWERVSSGGGRFVGEGQQTIWALTTYRGDFVAVGSRGGARGDLDGGVWTSADGVRWRAPTQLSPNVTALGGKGHQTLRALVVYSRHGISLFGFGATNEGEVEDARVWTARVPGG
jgi:hypothetical protein